jgi:prepilin-type N-terminal cleavage/methylation domain-containing protein
MVLSMFTCYKWWDTHAVNARLALWMLGPHSIIYELAADVMKPPLALLRPVEKLHKSEGRLRGFTLVEVMVSLGIVTLLFGGILSAYIQTSRQAEWAGYSLAAQSLGILQIEQARSGVWDYSISKNELTNLNLLSWSYNAATKVGTGYSTSVLDLPVSGTNIVVATNFVTVKMLNLSGSPNVQVQMVMVDTVWPFQTLHGKRVFTNRTASYFGPDNRDASSL